MKALAGGVCGMNLWEKKSKKKIFFLIIFAILRIPTALELSTETRHDTVLECTKEHSRKCSIQFSLAWFKVHQIVASHLKASSPFK